MQRPRDATAFVGDGGGAPERGVPGSEDFTEYLLEHICVQRPYFALENVRQEGPLLTALAHLLTPPVRETDAVALAEAARHTSVLGACAARLADVRKGRVFCPLSAIRLLRADTSALSRASTVLVGARLVQHSLDASTAVVETSLQDAEGRELCLFLATFHLIPEAEFELSFAWRYQQSSDPSAVAPRRTWPALPAFALTEDQALLDLGSVRPEDCLGHFVNYPAYPFSMMARSAIRALDEAIRQRSAKPRARIDVVGGEAQIRRFAFAGERLSLAVHRVGGASGQEAWRLAFFAEGEECAWLHLHVQVGD